MPTTRYHPSRTLTRRVTRLREHFEAFNVDTAELCQWFMKVAQPNK